MWLPKIAVDLFLRERDTTREALAKHLAENGSLRASLGAANATIAWLQQHVNRIETDRAFLLQRALRVAASEAPGIPLIARVNPEALAGDTATVGVGSPTRPPASLTEAQAVSFQDVGDEEAARQGLEDHELAGNLKE